VAVVGRPNVGKSSFINKLLGEQRLIVSPVAGLRAMRSIHRSSTTASRMC